MKTLGERLKECRKEKAIEKDVKTISQKTVAKAVGMSQVNLSELENDLYPTSSFIPALADYYGVRALWLSDGKGRKELAAKVNPRLAHLIKILDGQPDYVVDEAIKNVDSLIELLEKARGNNGTQ